MTDLNGGAIAPQQLVEQLLALLQGLAPNDAQRCLQDALRGLGDGNTKKSDELVSVLVQAHAESEQQRDSADAANATPSEVVESSADDVVAPSAADLMLASPGTHPSAPVVAPAMADSALVPSSPAHLMPANGEDASQRQLTLENMLASAPEGDPLRGALFEVFKDVPLHKLRAVELWLCLKAESARAQSVPTLPAPPTVKPGAYLDSGDVDAVDAESYTESEPSLSFGPLPPRDTPSGLYSIESWRKHQRARQKRWLLRGAALVGACSFGAGVAWLVSPSSRKTVELVAIEQSPPPAASTAVLHRPPLPALAPLVEPSRDEPVPEIEADGASSVRSEGHAQQARARLVREEEARAAASEALDRHPSPQHVDSPIPRAPVASVPLNRAPPSKPATVARAQVPSNKPLPSAKMAAPKRNARPAAKASASDSDDVFGSRR